MSAKDMARRVELRLKFQNVKVPADINKYLKEKIQYDCTIYVTGHSKGGNNALYAKAG